VRHAESRKTSEPAILRSDVAHAPVGQLWKKDVSSGLLRATTKPAAIAVSDLEARQAAARNTAAASV
jgi:hypothetical protein